MASYELRRPAKLRRHLRIWPGGDIFAPGTTDPARHTGPLRAGVSKDRDSASRPAGYRLGGLASSRDASHLDGVASREIEQTAIGA
jgi:hypothetical protein